MSAQEETEKQTVHIKEYFVPYDSQRRLVVDPRREIIRFHGKSPIKQWKCTNKGHTIISRKDLTSLETEEAKNAGVILRAEYDIEE